MGNSSSIEPPIERPPKQDALPPSMQVEVYSEPGHQSFRLPRQSPLAPIFHTLAEYSRLQMNSEHLLRKIQSLEDDRTRHLARIHELSKAPVPRELDDGIRRDFERVADLVQQIASNLADTYDLSCSPMEGVLTVFSDEKCKDYLKKKGYYREEEQEWFEYMLKEYREIENRTTVILQGLISHVVGFVLFRKIFEPYMFGIPPGVSNDRLQLEKGVLGQGNSRPNKLTCRFEILGYTHDSSGNCTGYDYPEA